MNEHSDFPKNINRPFGGVTMPSMLDHAIDYAREHGWPVFPCDPKTKRPLTENGFKDASTDPERISAWWHRHPNAMIGIPTGAASHVVVLDVDVDPDKGIDGRQSLDGLELPPTMAVRTPRGGIHYYFDWPDGTEIRNSAGQIGPGLDVRGEGGYVIVPPSINASGKSYQWATGEGPVRVPDWFLERTRKEERPPQREWTSMDVNPKRMQPYGDKMLSRICDECAFAPVGTRHEIFLPNAIKMFSKVKGGYSTFDRVNGYLRDAGLAAGRTAREVDNDLRDAYAYATPSGLPEDRAHYPRSNGTDNPQAPLEREQSKAQEAYIGPAVIDFADSLHIPIRSREWLDQHKLLRKNTAFQLNGDGGIGKTEISLQMMIGMCATGSMFRMPVERGPCLFVSFEEPENEIRWRIDHLAHAFDIPSASVNNLKILDLTGERDPWMFKEKNKELIPQPAWTWLQKEFEQIKPMFIVMDNKTRFFGGNQNDAVLATSYAHHIELACRDFDTTIMPLAHVSLSQLSSGRGDSGSVAAGNAFRSRMLFGHADPKREADEEDDGARKLTVMKANATPTGHFLDFKWHKGLEFFDCLYEPPRADEGIGRPDKAKRIFRTQLRWHNEHNIRVSASPSSPRNYAPKKFFASKKECEGVSFKELETAMRTLLDNGEIINQPYGPPSDKTHELILK